MADAKETPRFKAAKPEPKLVPKGFKLVQREYNVRIASAGDITVEGYGAVPESFAAAEAHAGREVALALLQNAWLWKAQHGTIASLKRAKADALAAEVNAHARRMAQYRPKAEGPSGAEIGGVKFTGKQLEALKAAGVKIE